MLNKIKHAERKFHALKSEHPSYGKKEYIKYKAIGALLKYVPLFFFQGSFYCI